MDKELFITKRKNYIEIDELYFFTATINNWQHLLKEDIFKEIIINSIQNLSSRNLLEVFGFLFFAKSPSFYF